MLSDAGIRYRVWELERDGQALTVDPSGPLIVTPTVFDLAVNAAVAGHGVIYLFEEWLEPYIASGALRPRTQAAHLCVLQLAACWRRITARRRNWRRGCRQRSI